MQLKNFVGLSSTGPRRRGRTRAQFGATLVETAYIILPLFILIFGIIEFGRAYSVYQTATNAAREGARFSAAPCTVAQVRNCSGQSVSCTAGSAPSSTQVKSCVQGFLVSNAIKVPDGNISVDQNQTVPVNGIDLSYSAVNVTAPYNFIFFPFGTLNLKSKAVMRNENN
jgi:Flp pilus assembly protein TadG